MLLINLGLSDNEQAILFYSCLFYFILHSRLSHFLCTLREGGKHIKLICDGNLSCHFDVSISVGTFVDFA